MSDNGASTLAALTARYSASLADKLREAERLFADAGRQGFTGATLSALKGPIHRVAGSASVYGFHELGNAAARLDEQLSNALAGANLDSAALVRDFDAVRQAFQAAIDRGGRASFAMPAISQVDIVFLLNDTDDLGTDLEGPLCAQGIGAEVFLDVDALVQALSARVPRAVIVGEHWLRDATPRGRITGAVDSCPSPRPRLVVLSNRVDFDTRMRVVMSGAAAFFPKPVNVHGLITLLNEVWNEYANRPYRVVMVEDDSDQSGAYATEFRAAGVDFRVIKDPGLLVENLIDFQPELVLMGLHLPRYSGIDLTKMLRQHESFFNIPIMILSSDQNRDMRIKALASGADNFIAKQNVSHGELVHIVTSRVQRLRRLENLIDYDPLTGLLNRMAFMDRLVRELSRSRDVSERLCLAMLDIDFFKGLNDSYGHLLGDAALKTVARSLTQGLRRMDIIGRYGGDELMVFLPHTGLDAGHRVIERLRLAVAGQPVELGEVSISLTVSAGLLAIEGHGSGEFRERELDAWIERADSLLYRAKAEGRNRVVSEGLQLVEPPSETERPA